MKPYNKNFVFQEMTRYNKLINPGTCGNYKIVKNIIKKQNLQGYMYKNKEEYDIDVIQLIKDDISLMRFTPKEIQSSYGAIHAAQVKLELLG